MKLHLISVILLILFIEIISTLRRIPCPTLKLKNGRVRYRQKNRFVKFACSSGFLLAGERYSTCENGRWDGELPKCVRSSCIKVTPPPNALIYPSHRGGVLNFFCKPGYTLNGLNITYCDGLNWDNKLPSCIESNTQPKLQCDFENEDLCGWNHDLRHDFEWTRKNFKTPSGHLGTGPSYDHTKGNNSDGYYMYIESSFRNENDTARLISPIFGKMNDSNVCFEFYYHMYGSTTGQLRVYLKKVSRDWNLKPYEAFFWKWGNHGERWIRNVTFIGPIDEDFQFVIEGVRGAGHFSDIAVDDISIIPNCTSEESTTERDFEYTWEDDDAQSCINRCDTSNPSFLCDCDENCIDNNRCCADYIATCVLGTEEYSSTNEVTTVDANVTPTNEYITELHYPISSVVNSFTIPKTTTRRPTPQTTRTTTTPNTTTQKTTQTTRSTTTPNTTTRRTTQTTRRATTPNTTTRRTTQTTRSTTTPNTTTRRTTRTTSRATIPNTTTRRTTQTTRRTTTPSTRTRRTTQQIILRTTPNTTRKTTTKIVTTTTTTQKPTTSSTTFRITVPTKKILPITPPLKPLTKTPTKTSPISNKTVPQLIDEIITIPNVQDTDEILYISAITQNLPNVALERNVNKEQNNITDVNYVLIVMVAVAVIVFVIVLTVVLIRRYRFIGCRMNKMKTSISDSQSDVRFLTSDEVLNFNLAYCDD